MQVTVFLRFGFEGLLRTSKIFQEFKDKWEARMSDGCPLNNRVLTTKSSLIYEDN